MAVTNKSILKDWFKTGLKPLQEQFWAWLDSFWHKDEKIPITAIEDIEEILNDKAEKEPFNLHLIDPDAHFTQFEAKEDKSTKGEPNGYVPLDEFAKVASQFLNIINDVTTGGATSLLSAEQGKVLQTQINGINALLTSDNVNLDTVQELVDAIETIQTSLATILVNDLTTGGVTKALTAEQGKVLNNLKLTGTLATDAETQITSAVTEDNKFVSRLKLFNWSGSAAFMAKIRAVTLTGISFSSTTVVTASDTILSAIGSLQAQISNKAVLSDFVSSITNVVKIPTIKSIIDFKNDAAFWKSTSFAGTIDRVLHSGSDGTILATYEIVEQENNDNDIITAILAATFNSGNNYTSSITPANSKILLKGCYVFNGNYQYIARSNNNVSRIPLG